MSITVPQLFMLSHAMYVNHERSERRFKRKQGHKTEVEEVVDEEVPTFNGKPLSECNSQEMLRYYGSWS